MRNLRREKKKENFDEENEGERKMKREKLKEKEEERKKIENEKKKKKIEKLAALGQIENSRIIQFERIQWKNENKYSNEKMRNLKKFLVKFRGVKIRSFVSSKIFYLISSILISIIHSFIR